MVTVEVSEEVWKEMLMRKEPGDSFDDVLRRQFGVGGTSGAASQQHQTEHEPEDESDIDRDQLRDELAGSGQLLERRVNEILNMYARLRELERAEKDDLLDAVDVGAARYQDEDSAWANMVKGKDTLRSLPGVEPPPPGNSEWRYTPP